MTQGIQKPKIVFVEDCRLAANTYHTTFANEFDVEYLHTLDELQTYLANPGAKPSLLVLDLLFGSTHLFDRWNPSTLAKALDGWKWVVVSSQLDPQNMDKAYAAGTLDCIDKLQGVTTIAARIKRAIRGAYYSHYSGFKINNKNRHVYLRQYRTERTLSPIELAILNCLFEARDHRATAQEIMWEIFAAKVGTNIERHICSLRKALKPLPGVNIETIKGGGYALEIR